MPRSVGGAVASAILLAAVEAAAAEDSPVRLAPLQLPTDLAPADRERIESAARQGLDRAGFRVETESDRVVTFTIERRESDYVVQAVMTERGDEVVAADEECELCGIAELSETVAALSGRIGQRFALTRAPATLEVESRPRGATVMVDGTVVGTTPLTHEVDAGPHTIEVSKPGYRSDTRSFDAVGGATERFSLTLRGGAYKRWLPWTALAAGLVGIGVGAALIAIDDREIERDCNPDVDGRCQYLHETMAGGVVSTVIGVGLVATGVALAIVWRDRKGTRGQEARVRGTAGGFAVRFAP